MIKIKWTRNGAIMTVEGLAEVYEFSEDKLSRLADMLYDIKEQTCPGGKYDKERVNIVLEHGRDYKCRDEVCEICHPV